ncbi:proline-rich small protein YnaL [Shimwellia pseudoproteus]
MINLLLFTRAAVPSTIPVGPDPVPDPSPRPPPRPHPLPDPLPEEEPIKLSRYGSRSERIRPPLI